MEESNPHGLNSFVLMLCHSGIVETLHSPGELAHRALWRVAQTRRTEGRGRWRKEDRCPNLGLSLRGLEQHPERPLPNGGPGTSQEAWGCFSSCEKRQAWPGLGLWAGGRGRREDGVVQKDGSGVWGRVAVTAGRFPVEVALNSGVTLRYCIIAHPAVRKAPLYLFSLFFLLRYPWDCCDTLRS